MSPALLARCCFGYRGGIVHVHVGKPQIVELLIQLFLTVNYGGPVGRHLSAKQFLS